MIVTFMTKCSRSHGLARLAFMQHCQYMQHGFCAILPDWRKVEGLSS